MPGTSQEAYMLPFSAVLGNFTVLDKSKVAYELLNQYVRDFSNLLPSARISGEVAVKKNETLFYKATDMDEAWIKGADLIADPIENKLRRDWLSELLCEQLDGLRMKDDVAEWEYLANYADKIFVECVDLLKNNPIAKIENGVVSINREAGWSVRDSSFSKLFEYPKTACAALFEQWLESGGEEVRACLLGIFCNKGAKSLREAIISFGQDSLVQEPKQKLASIKP